jgi:hypothetical protein
MEALGLRTAQQPFHVGRLLQALVSRGNLVPKDCHQILSVRELSPPLRRIVSLASATGHVWACWADNLHTWLFTCEMSLPLSRKRSAPVLEVSVYDEAGELKEAGAWVAGRDGNWSRFAA